MSPIIDTPVTRAEIDRAPPDLRKPMGDAVAASYADYDDPERLPMDFRVALERGAIMDFLLQLGDESPAGPPSG